MSAMAPRACRPLLLAAALIGTLAPAAPGSGILYNVTNLGVNTPVALNDAGQVALNQSTSFGYYDPINDGIASDARHTSQSSYTHALLYDSYGTNAGNMTYVGQALPTATGGPSGLDTVTTLLGQVIAKPDRSDIATGLTSSGQVVLYSAAGTFQTDGKTYQAAPTSPISDPRVVAGLTVTAAGTNASGQVVGTAMLPASQIAYVPGNHGTYNLGQHAFLLDGGKLTDLNSVISSQLNITLNNAIAINATGQILAEGYGGTNFVENAFLLTPVGQPLPGTAALAPEPGTLAILGLAAGAWWLRRRAA